MSTVNYITFRNGKRYVFNDINKVGDKIVFSSGFDDDSVLPSDSQEIAKQPDTIYDILARAGYSPERITEIVKEKYDNFEKLDSIAKSVTYQDYLTKENKTSTDGSLVSNSAQALKNNTTYQNLKIEIEKNRNILLSEHNELLKKGLQMQDNNLLMQSQIYSQMLEHTDAIKALTTVTKNQNLSPTYQAGQINVTVPDFDIPAPVVNIASPDVNVNPTVQIASPTVNIDTKAIADATNVSNQALTESLTAQTTAITNQTDIIKTAEDAKLVEMRNHIEAVKAQKFDASFGDVSVTMNTDALNANTQKTADAIVKIANANEKIALGQENQIQTNTKIVENIEKKNEHLDYLKNGHEQLKDSEGNKIIPREIQAKKDAEVHIDKESLNKTTIDEIMEFNQDIREFLEGNSVEGVFSDALGATSGFVDDLNPLKAILQHVLNSHEKEHNPEYQPPKEGA